jgi:hypothetical protein
MKTLLRKQTIAAAIACLTLGVATVAQAGSCSNATLKGQYGQTISGEILPAPGVVLAQNGVAMTSFDGKGKFIQKDFVVINGAPTSTGFATGETGTYMVSADCTGTATVNHPDGSWIDLELVVVKQGEEFHTVVSSLSLAGVLNPANIGSTGVRVDNPDEEHHK